MKAIIRLKPAGRGVYALVVQASKSFYTSPVLAKLGLVTLRYDSLFIEFDYKAASVWFRQGAVFSNKRLFRLVASSYGKS